MHVTDQDMSEWSDARIDSARFRLMKKKCDENGIAYPQKLTAYILANGDDPAKW